MQTIWGKEVYESVDELLGCAKTAVLVVDMQNDFCHPEGYYGRLGIDLEAIQAAVSAMDGVVRAARQVGLPVIWVQQTLLKEARSDSTSWLRRRTHGTLPPEWTLDGQWGHEFARPLAPLEGEPVIQKHRSSAFVGTPLDLILRSLEIELAVIGGAVTQGCVESTARDATFYDYYVVLLTDCVATTSAELHHASMKCQSSRYDFASSKHVIRRWRSTR
jgi:ureidoacrylate peracid hydrolase